MWQFIKFGIITLLLNEGQKANLAAVFAKRKANKQSLSRHALYSEVEADELNRSSNLLWLILDAAEFGPEDQEPSQIQDHKFLVLK